jgi:hypothetical protein
MAGSPVEIASLSLAALAEAVDSEDPTPGGGAVAACAAGSPSTWHATGTGTCARMP